MNHTTGDTPHDRTLDRYERNRFFHGKLMTARDMRAEQHYHVDRLDTHARFLAGSGVVCGLEATVEQEDPSSGITVTVAPGLALDCAGRQIVVEGPTPVDLERPTEDTIHLYLTYEECVKESVPKHGSESACETECEYNRVLEVFGVEYSGRTAPSHDHRSVPHIEYPTPDDFEDDEDDPNDLVPLFTMARSYYELTEADDGVDAADVGSLRACPTCEQEGVFLGTFTSDGGDWTRDRSVQRRFAYTADMLHAAIARHVSDFENPHWVALGVEADGDGARLLVEGQDDEEGTVGIRPSDGVTITTDGDDIEVGVDVDTEDIEADVDRLERRVDALERYVLYRSLCHKRVAFSVVAETFAETDIEERAMQVVEMVSDALDDERFTEPEAYAEFVQEVGEAEEELGDTLEESELATERSRRRYELALERLQEVADDGSAFAIAAAQDCVSEAASWLRSRRTPEVETLTCLTFEEFQPGEEFDDPVEGQGTTIQPRESARFVEDETPNGGVSMQFQAAGLDIDVPTSSYVEVEVFSGASPITLEAYNATGSLVALEETPEDIRRFEATFTFTVRAQNVERLRVREGDNEGSLVKVCRM